MKKKDYIILFVISATLGGIVGALAATTENDGNNLELWAIAGAATMSITSILLKGRLLSLIFLRFTPVSTYEGHREGEWRQFVIIIGFMGFFVGSLQFGWIDHVSDGMLYIVFPSLVIACYGIGYLIHERLKGLGSIVFGVIGLTWGTYSFLVATQ